MRGFQLIPALLYSTLAKSWILLRPAARFGTLDGMMTKLVTRRSMVLTTAMLLSGFGVSTASAQTAAGGASGAKTGPLGILTREQAGAILPASVFYRGQSATVQARNSSGIRLSGDRLILAAVVDTGGYSTAVQQTYQAYLITEVPLRFGGGQTLPPGAYGFGFQGDKMVVMDLGANEILHAQTVHDPSMARPNPLQILPDGEGRYKLYMGRNYVAFSPVTSN